MTGPVSDWLSGTTVAPSEEQPSNVVPFKKDSLVRDWLNTSDPIPNYDTPLTPDQEAKNRKLSEQSNLPRELVDVDPKEVEKLVHKQQVDSLVKDAPITRGWLSDLNNFSVAHDDVENLTTVEDIWTTSNVLTGMSEAAQRSLAGIGDFALSLAQDLEKNPNRQLGPIESYIKDTFTDWSKLNNQPGHYVPSLTWDEMNESVFNWINPLKLAQYGGERAITSIPSMVEAVFSPGTFTMGLTGDIAQTRAKNEGRGEATTGDMLKALPAAVISAQLERLGAMKLFSGNPFKGIFGEGVTEAGQSLTENVGATVGTEKGFDAPTAAIATLQGFVDGILAGGVQRGTVDVYLKAVDKLRQTTTAKVFEQRLNKTQEALAASAVVPRAPDVALNHLASVMKEAGIKSVLLSVEGINELANKLELSPIDVAKQLGVRPQYEREYLRGGNIELSPEQLGSLMLDENWSALSGHIRENEEAFTTKEAEEYETSGLKEEIAASLTVAEDSGIPVFHGSRHEFDAFKKEGTALTGEGSQSFGAGIYVAEARKTAEFYKGSTLGDIDFSNLPPELEAKYGKEYDALNKKLDATLLTEGTVDDYNKAVAPIWSERNKLKDQILKEYRDTYGRLYEARLDVTDDELVLLDESFKKQSNKVKTAFKKAYDDAQELANTNDPFPEDRSAENIFREMEAMVGTDDASKLLEKYGVAGIKFQDNFSRNAVSNYQSAADRIKSWQEEIRQDIMMLQFNEDNVKSETVTKEEYAKTKKSGEERIKKAEKEIEALKDVIKKGPGDVTHNYVVFDPNRLRIIKKNDIPITQAEIDVTAIEQELGTDGLFTTSEEAGMTPNGYMFYLASLKKAHDAAVNRQNEKLLKDAQRKVNKEYKAIKKDMKESVRESLANSPVYQAINSIQKDRLDRAILADLLGGEKFLDSLPKQSKGRPIYTNKDETGGLDPSAVAEAYGFPSATDMVLAMLTAKPFEEAVETTTQQMMQRSYPDLSNAKARLDEALESLHNDYTGEVLTQELNRLREMAALQKAEKIARKEAKSKEDTEDDGKTKKPLTEAQKEANKVRHIKLQVMKAAVKKQLDATQIKDIRVGRFVKTARDQGKLAGKLLRKGDIDGAIDAKFKQLTNFIMAQQAYKVKAEVEKQNKKLNKLSSRKGNKLPTTYYDMISQKLSDYNIGPKISDKTRQRMQAWVDKQLASGAIFTMPPQLINDKKINWQDMPLGEWRELVSAIKNIEAQGRNQKQTTALLGNIKFEHEKAVLLKQSETIPDTARAKHGEKSAVTRKRDKAAAGIAGFDASMVKMENLLRDLDGETIGPWWNAVFKKYSIAQNEKLDMMEKHIRPIIQDAFKTLPKKILKRMNNRVFVPSLGKEFTYSQLLKLGANMGNPSNIQKVLDGHNNHEKGKKWTRQDLVDAMALLSPEEGRWLQQVWDQLETFRPAVERVYEAENGIPAERVTISSIIIGGIKLKGGYFPMQYANTPSFGTPLEALQDPLIRSSIFSGMTKERTDFSAPVDLDLNGMLNALEQQIHFITHYEAVRSVNNILNDRELTQIVRDKLGDEYLTELKNWHSAVASGGMSKATNDLMDKAAELFRSNVTSAALAGNLVTVASQLLGVFSSIAQMGKPIKKGDKFSSWRGLTAFSNGTRIYVSKKNAVRDAALLSGELRHRLANQDRDARANMERLKGKTDLKSRWNKMMIYLVSGSQLYVVDIPTWIGAYNLGLKDGMSVEKAIDYADNMLRTSQGAGHTKDLSGFQREPGVKRLFTMFSTWTFIQYNLQRDILQTSKKFPVDTFMKLVWVGLIPAVISSWIHGNLGPDDDEEETWAGWLAQSILGYNLGSIPVVGQWPQAYTQKYGFSLTPVQRIPDVLERGLDTVVKAFDEDEDLDYKDMSNMIKALGFGIGIGGTTTAGRVFDTLNKAEDEDVDWWEYLTGPKD